MKKNIRFIIISAILFIIKPELHSQQFTEQESISLPKLQDGVVVWGDYDNDNDLDILITGWDITGKEVTKIYRNNNNNSFSEQTSISLVQVGGSSAEWGDYDNDGDLDILLTGWDGNTEVSKIYRNNGDNTFTEQTSISLTGVSFSSVAWGDYDNDGDLDILLTGSSSSGNVSKIYKNNGNNTFIEQTSIILTGVRFGSVAWGDYDNDGDLDILLTGSIDGGQVSKIYRNNGNNTFIEQTSIYLLAVGGSSAAWGDYDNDGDLDIILTGWAGSGLGRTSRIYKNNGDNTFTEQTSISLAGVVYGSAVWGDYDNDGDLDILLMGYTGNNRITKIYRNNSDNTFAEQIAIALHGIESGAVAWGDYDNDGDLDILMMGYDGNVDDSKIYRNNNLTSNTKPTVPTNLASQIIENHVTFRWNKSTDNETPQVGLRYNLVIGSSPNAVNTLSPMADRNTGYNRIINLGIHYRYNAFGATVSELPNGTYYWSVQAIDNSFAGSSFASEQSFTIDVDNKWITVQSNTDRNLKNIKFQDYLNGYSWGDDVLIKTTNGGVDWYMYSDFLNHNLDDVIFINDFIGWGSVFDSTNFINILMNTNDGGKTWVNQYIYPVSSNYPHCQYGSWNNTYSRISFIDGNNGWITTNNGLRRTTNGGLTWEAIDDSQGLFDYLGECAVADLNFISNTIGFLLFDGGYVNDLYKTIDGGISWEKIHGYAERLQDYHFLDTDHGWYTSRIVEYSELLPCFIYRTTNGKNWQGLDTANEVYEKIYFFDTLNGWFNGYTLWDLGEPSMEYIKMSTDGGESWVIQNSNLSNVTNPRTYVGRINSFFSLDGESVWAVGNEGLIMKFEDSTPALTLPIITVQPQDQTITEGQTISFNVEATCDGPLDFQWWAGDSNQWNNGDKGGRLTVVNTSNSSTLTITNVNLAEDNNNIFGCEVKNLDGYPADGYWVNSATAKLFVLKDCFAWLFISNTGKNASIAIPLSTNPTIGTDSLKAGDVIGVFYRRNDSLICGGYTVWQNENTSITAWGDNDQTSIKDGFYEGEEIVYKIFKTNTCEEYIATATYQLGSSTYSTNGIYILSSLKAVTITTYTGLINSGWNMISSNIKPTQSNLDSLAKSIKYNLVIIKNGQGQVYWPQYNINSIGQWNSYHGYQTYMSALDTLKFTGTLIKPDTAVMILPSGWNMISYIRSAPMRCDSALTTIANSIVVVKDNSGNVYWPQFSINTIGQMQAGQGYQVYLKVADTLIYPQNTTTSFQFSKSAIDVNEITSHYKIKTINTGSNAILLVHGMELKGGDEIGVWDSKKNLIGNGIIEDGRAIVTIWGDNEITIEDKDGAKEDETLGLTLFDNEKQKEVSLDISSIINGLSSVEQGKVLKYNRNAVLVIQVIKTSTIPTAYYLEQNYPNPFNPSTKIKYGLPKSSQVTLDIYNVLGEKVKTLVNEFQEAGNYGTTVNLLDLSSGIYLYSLKAGDFNQTKKMILIK